MQPADEATNAQRRRKRNVLFLCTGNACRSQMAEGWARRLRADAFDAYSAGIEPHGMNPRAIRAMAEAGVDISESAIELAQARVPAATFAFAARPCGGR